MRRIDVRMVETARVRQDLGPNWMPLSNKEALDLYDKLFMIVMAAAEKGKSISRQWLVEKLADEYVEIYASSSPNIKTTWTVPFYSLGVRFIGRQSDLDELHRQLMEHGKVGITGMGGLGKTQMAVEYANNQKDSYPDGVFWLNAANLLLIELAELAETLGLAEHQTARDQAAFAVRDYLEKNPQTLIIFDNLEKPKSLNLQVAAGLIPTALKCRLLFTTRKRDFPSNMQLFEVKVLDEEAGLHLLLRGRSEVLDSAHSEYQTAGQIVDAMGGLPLALELAVAYFEKFKQTTLKGYLDLLASKGGLSALDLSPKYTRLNEQDLATRHSVAITATLEMQWKTLHDPDAQQLFLVAGQLPAVSWIPTARLGLLAGISGQPEPEKEVSLLDIALAELQAVSLIVELSSDRLRLHPLVHEFAASIPPDPFDLRKELAANLADAMKNMGNLGSSNGVAWR